jgi:hypothetical protein
MSKFIYVGSLIYLPIHLIFGLINLIDTNTSIEAFIYQTIIILCVSSIAFLFRKTKEISKEFEDFRGFYYSSHNHDEKNRGN